MSNNQKDWTKAQCLLLFVSPRNARPRLLRGRGAGFTPDRVLVSRSLPVSMRTKMAMADLHISISSSLSVCVLSLLLLLFFFSNAYSHHLSVRLPLLGSLSLSAHQPNTDDVHDLLPHYGLPPGLLPDNVESYALDPSGSFSIQLTTPCYVHFDLLVYFEKEIKGKLTYGAVREVSGIQAKKLFLWVTITGMEVSKDGDGMIEFFAGALSEKLPAKQFEEVPVCRSKAADLRTKLASI